MDITLPFVAVLVLLFGLWMLWLTSKRYKKRQFIKMLKTLRKVNPRAAYELYLASPYWQEKRVMCFERFFYRCALCGSPHNLQAHHISYAHLFEEIIWELVCLCRDCHARYAPKSDGLYKA